MKPALFMLTVGGLGLLRPAPGTWGSLPPVVLMLGLALLDVPHWMINVIAVLMCLVFSIACVRLGVLGEARFGRKDAPQIVADEVAGQSIALLFLPWRAPVDATALGWNIAMAGSAFLAFRFFDITKPPPAHSLQRLPSGWGVLVDDLVAGLYALAVIQLVLLLI